MKRGKKPSKKAKKKKKKVQSKRCVKRYSLPLNKLKWLLLLEIVESYAQQKDYFLTQYPSLKNIYACYSFRDIRNLWVSRDYQSPFGLQKRGWKLALKDSLETLDRYWAALTSLWKGSIFQSNLSEEEKHYIFRAIYSRKNLDLVLRYGAKVTLGLDLTLKQRKRCIRFLLKLIKKSVGESPRVKLARSFLAEPETYRTFFHKGRQYIAIASKEKGKRLIIPLTGKGKISGQIRVVLDFERRRIEIHQIVKKGKYITPPKGDAIGIDWGITEVLTDSDSDRWGKDFGKSLTKYSEQIKNKGKKRNKLHAVAKKHKKKRNHKKYKKVLKHNLGSKKQKKSSYKRKTHLENQVNRALNEFLPQKDPKIISCEDLTHLRGKAKSKKLSRLVSLWIRNIINERFEFKVLQRGSLLKRANPAYSSQICLNCGWVHRGNRNGDLFKCQFCGHTAASDWSAALELLRRLNDPEISLWTPKEQVKRLLLQRFRRRLESWDFPLDPSQVAWESVRKEFPDVDGIREKLGVDVAKVSTTVPGKTPDTSEPLPVNRSGRDNPDNRGHSESETHAHHTNRVS